MKRAGTKKIGRSSIDNTVTCHEIATMTPAVSASDTRFVTTPDSVLEKARCAPITSLLSREISAPVRVRLKNATGRVCT